MKTEPIRKEVYLDSETIRGLQREADKERRSLKAQMEFILMRYVKYGIDR